MIKEFTAEHRFDCGIDEAFAGKVWCFVPVIPLKSPGLYGLGVAVANEHGYSPVPITFCNAATFDEMEYYAAQLNAEMGWSETDADKIVGSTMRRDN